MGHATFFRVSDCVGNRRRLRISGLCEIAPIRREILWHQSALMGALCDCRSAISIDKFQIISSSMCARSDDKPCPSALTTASTQI